ncbi:LysR family transcriptional regulator [Comamonas endophytica]|uniref:LysR substrate-binding domain-containing protein n=1 Tax=Comamonas endophytica TaxID=2949090 RepID=A0ABY6G8I9_9BURK|nr:MULTISPECIES: LysR substrate-binding domain-containing protein [unclassified Acidovorax]MCD2514057.1 LysR substrate-binding domain-containing protein [Acidovorax sp. D4N7]UYG51201.1 LysR substrate-binding domain-containing protein [Acidovorax sp. 5MLIR]
MDLTRLTYFVAVAEAGSFSRAAAALHLSQPALSRQVLLLEEELGQRLLERTGRGVVLTESGRALLQHAHGILALAAQAESDMQERLRSPRGRVTIGLPPWVARAIAADLVQGFLQEYPDVTICIEENLSVSLREWLMAGRLDLALLFDPPHSPQIMMETLLREPLVLVSSEALPSKIRLSALSQRSLTMARGPNALRRLLESYTEPRGLPLRLVAEVDSVHTVLSLVARGMGDSVLPWSAAKAWASPLALHVAQVVSPVVRNRLVLAVPRARPANRVTRFAEHLLKRVVAEQLG